MTGAGFPHSDTLGSTLGWQLPEAYRSLPRPSSAPDAQASTVCPYQLDHTQQNPPEPTPGRAYLPRPFETKSQRCSRPLCSSQPPTREPPPTTPPAPAPAGNETVWDRDGPGETTTPTRRPHQGANRAGGARSLRTQQR